MLVVVFFLSLHRLQPGRQPDSTRDVIQAKYNAKCVCCCLIRANGSRAVAAEGLAAWQLWRSPWLAKQAAI